MFLKCYYHSASQLCYTAYKILMPKIFQKDLDNKSSMGVNTWCHSISVTFKFWCWVPRESVLRGSSALKATRTAQNLKVTLIEWLLKLTLLEWHQVFRPVIFLSFTGPERYGDECCYGKTSLLHFIVFFFLGGLTLLIVGVVQFKEEAGLHHARHHFLVGKKRWYNNK